jgi:hypothetical protein
MAFTKQADGPGQVIRMGVWSGITTQFMRRFLKAGDKEDIDIGDKAGPSFCLSWLSRFPPAVWKRFRYPSLALLTR